MAYDSRNTSRQPVQDYYSSPTQNSDTRETLSSPTSPETSYPGHFNSPRPFFRDDSNYANNSGYPSPSHGWDSLEQNPPLYSQRGESPARLLGSSRGDRSPTPPGATQRRPPRWWTLLVAYYKRYWTPAWSMVFFLMAGIAFACGHHAYYRHLDGTTPDEQLRKLRYGTALAFFAKTSLATAVILAYRQRVWMIVRHKILPLSVVDSLFAAVEDLLALLHWEAFKRARAAMFLALYIWSTPLVVILTSETLSVQPKRIVLNTTCPGVQTLNFTHEISNYWRNATKAKDGFYPLSVSIWNTTKSAANFSYSNPDSFDYWGASSKQFERLAIKSIYLSEAVPQENISQIICGEGWNCSVSINFIGPGYRCTRVASGVNDTVKTIRGSESPFNTTKLVPVGDEIYHARTDQGDYGRQLEEVWPGGIPLTEAPWPENLGVFRTEPLMWIGYASTELDPMDVPHDKSNNETWTNKTFIPNIIGCEHYYTNYSVNLTYLNGVQFTKVTQHDNISRIMETRFLPEVWSSDNDGLFDNTTATPSSKYIHPRDLDKYRLTAAYHSVGKRLRDALNGSIAIQEKASTSDIVATRLIEKRNYLAVDHFAREVEKFYEDLLLSLLSDPQFVAVSWAYDPSKTAKQDMDYGYNHSKYDCIKEQTSNRYQYHVRDLWLVYSIAILLATIAVILGISAMRHENTFRDTKFSSIIAVTRGRSLNDVVWDTDGVNVKNVKVGFGRVRDMAGDTKTGFGLEGEVAQDKAEEPALRSPVVQLREWRERRTSRLMDGPRQL